MQWAVTAVRPTGSSLEKRAATIVMALRKLANSVVWIGALVMSLQELDYKIEPLLAGLGIAGMPSCWRMISEPAMSIGAFAEFVRMTTPTPVSGPQAMKL